MDKTGEIVVADKAHLRDLLDRGGRSYYTYLLRRPDGVACFNGRGTPFYVGIGRDMRMFSHVAQARDSDRTGRKVDAIQQILRLGGEVLHCIDSFHDREPWDREEALIRIIGQAKHGTGPLTNEQNYAPSLKLNGVELRKYAGDHRGDIHSVPAKFKLRDTRLAAGPNEPRSRDSVFGKIFTVLDTHPGVTGLELVSLLSRIDFSGNKSAYTQSGDVCSAWLCGYIEGGFFRSDRRHIQAFNPSSDQP